MDFLNTYKWYAIGTAFVLMLTTIGVKQYQVNSLRADLAESQSQTTILSSEITTQNKSIAKMKEDSQKSTAIGVEALKKAQVVSLGRQGKINALQSLLGKIDTCSAAVNSSREQL